MSGETEENGRPPTSPSVPQGRYRTESNEGRQSGCSVTQSYCLSMPTAPV